MKTLLRVFGVLIVIIALFFSVMSIYRTNEDKKDAETVQAEKGEAEKMVATYKEEVKGLTGETKVMMDEKIAEAEKQLENIPSPSTYLILEVMLVVLALLLLAFAVFLFRPNMNLVPKLLGLAVLLTLAAYFLSPDIKRGTYGGMENKTLALITGIPIIIVGLFAFIIAKKQQKQIA